MTMQHHIGTDIIEIERIRQAIERWGDRFLNRVYTEASSESTDTGPIRWPPASPAKKR